MDGIRSSLGGCLLAGCRACEFCHGESCRRWSPGAAPVAGVRGPWPDWERKEWGAGISLRAEARLGDSRDKVHTLGKGKAAPLRWDSEPSVTLPAPPLQAGIPRRAASVRAGPGSQPAMKPPRPAHTAPPATQSPLSFPTRDVQSGSGMWASGSQSPSHTIVGHSGTAEEYYARPTPHLKVKVRK